MFAFFNGIVAFIETVVNFIISLFELLVFVVVSIFRAVTWLFACVAYLPPFLTGFLLVPISLAIVFQILNKGD